MKRHSFKSAIAAGCAALFATGCVWDAAPGAADEALQSPLATLTSNPAIAGVAGCWRVTQGIYTGSLTVQQRGAGLYGFMDWDNHEDAHVTGAAGAGHVSMTFAYLGAKQGLIGEYPSQVSSDGRTLTSTGPVDFRMEWSPCKAGCWSITMEDYRGSLTLTSEAGRISGYVDWENHEDAVVTGRRDDGDNVDLRFDYLGSKAGVVGILRVTLAADGLRTLSGVTYDQAIPDIVLPVSGESIPCKDASGCFHVAQRNLSGARYQGLLRLDAAGGSISGAMDWQNHEDGVLTGTLADRNLRFALSYPGTPKEGLVGNYAFILDASGDYLTGGGMSNGGDSSTALGSRAHCPAP